jgi:hypothetical protein
MRDATSGRDKTLRLLSLEYPVKIAVYSVLEFSGYGDRSG